MAISVTVGSQVSIPTATTTNYAFDIESNNAAVILGVAQHAFGVQVTSVTYGGKSLVKRSEGAWSAGGHQRGEMWSYIGSDIPSGSNTMSIVTNGATTRIVVAYGISGSQLTQTEAPSKSSSSGNVQFTMDSSSDNAMGFVAGSHKSITSAALGNTTSDGTLTGEDSDLEIGHETTATTGSRAVGFTGSWLIGAAGLMVNEVDIVDTPDPITVEVNMPAPTITGITSIIDRPYPITVDVEMPVPVVQAPTPRQLPLVGVHADMPGRVPVNAVSNPVLTETDGVPAWIDSSGMPASAPTHVSTTGRTASDHHAKYLDSEAVTAVEGEATLALTGDVSMVANKDIIFADETNAVGSSTTVLNDLYIDNIRSGTGDAIGITADGVLALIGAGVTLIIDGAQFYPAGGGAHLGHSSNKWANLIMSGNILVDGTVDGVDIAARDHAKYTDAEAITAVEGEATLGLAGAVDVAKMFSLSSFDTIIGIGNLDDYDTNDKSLLFWSGNGDYDLTGLVALPQGTVLFFLNEDTNNTITLKNEDANSAAANRFNIAADLTLQPGDGVSLVYHADGLRWFIVGAHHQAVVPGSGTSFPGSPSTHDEFFRTDIRGGTMFRWNGTYWLTTQEYVQAHVFHRNALVGLVLEDYMSFDSSGLDVWVERLENVEYPVTSDISNYGTYELDKRTLLNASTSIAGWNTISDTAAQWNEHIWTTGHFIDVSTYPVLRAYYAIVGSPGAHYGGMRMTYRYVAT